MRTGKTIIELGAAGPQAAREQDPTVVVTLVPATTDAILELMALPPESVLVCVLNSMYGTVDAREAGGGGQSVMPGVGGLAWADAHSANGLRGAARAFAATAAAFPQIDDTVVAPSFAFSPARVANGAVLPVGQSAGVSRQVLAAAMTDASEPFWSWRRSHISCPTSMLSAAAPKSTGTSSTMTRTLVAPRS
jgi:hypothetical protein